MGRQHLLMMRCLRLILALSAIASTTSQSCERLKRSLTYTQEEAPRDLSGILPVVVARMNQELEGVVNVEVEYHGNDLQGKVGEHLIKCEVTRLASVVPEEIKDESVIDDMGRKVVSQCFEVPFTILDTNECTLPLRHPLRHQCRAPSVCVNTNGSYDCVCPKDRNRGAMSDHVKYPAMADEQFWMDFHAESRNPWEVAYNTSSRTSCPSQPSTHGCCSARANTKDAMACRYNFRCPQNPCNTNQQGDGGGAHDCAASAQCVRKETPNVEPKFVCQCPPGLMGNGHKCRHGIDPKPVPKVRFDGVTPTEETLKNNYFCDCTAPIVDACSGFPPCKGKHEICVVSASNVPTCGCKPGYVMHEKYGCVDEKPPIMKLRNDPHGDQTLRLRQGDIYKEDAVDIQDENAEEYMRSLKIAYSIPIPYGCLTKIGEFHVNYTIATPWTSPSFVRLTRRVIIEDINECTLDVSKYVTQCPPLVPKCDIEAGAKCVNKIGSYTCQCPKFTSGDGFLSGLSFPKNDAPIGFNGGTSCHDTSKPIIELNGPNPKVFRIAQCGVLTGIMNSKTDDRDADLKAAQQKYYGDDIRGMIRQTAGAELCATHHFTRPNASDCARAYDETYKSRIDLSKEVTVGDPLQTSMLQWRVPYNVEDRAGNKADTVWRDIVVEEVDLHDIEAKVLRECQSQALAEEKRRSGNRRQILPTTECPTCTPCDCSNHEKFDPSMCEVICENQRQTCQAGSDEGLSSAVRLVMWMEGLVPALFVTLFVAFCGLYVLFMVLYSIYTFAFGSTRYTPVYDATERERGLENSITVFSPQLQQNGATNGLPSGGGFGAGSPPMSRNQGPPTVSASLYGESSSNNNIFTPTPRNWASPPGSNGQGVQQPANIDIYERSPVITPNKRGQGVRQRTPYPR